MSPDEVVDALSEHADQISERAREHSRKASKAAVHRAALTGAAMGVPGQASSFTENQESMVVIKAPAPVVFEALAAARDEMFEDMRWLWESIEDF